MPPKLNIFTDVAIAANDHAAILVHLNAIVAEINVLIAGVRGCGRVTLDISVTIFAGIVCSLIQVRHCLEF